MPLSKNKNNKLKLIIIKTITTALSIFDLLLCTTGFSGGKIGIDPSKPRQISELNINEIEPSNVLISV